MSVQVCIASVGAIGPGADNWLAWRSVLRDEATYLSAPTVVPALNVLPAAERRRTGSCVKLALACGIQALESIGAAASEVTTVFCSSGADGDNCHQICETLASDDRLISPTRFHNSVHNAPSGYWGIASGAMLPSTSLCAYDGGFAVGLLEAAVQVAVEKRPVLLVVYDTPYPQPLHATRPLPDKFAVAVLLTPQAAATDLGRIRLQLDDGAQTVMAHPALEQLRRDIPAARCLPLLQAVACEEMRLLQLEYVNGRSLQVSFEPADS